MSKEIFGSPLTSFISSLISFDSLHQLLNWYDGWKEGSLSERNGEPTIRTGCERKKEEKQILQKKKHRRRGENLCRNKCPYFWGLHPSTPLLLVSIISMLTTQIEKYNIDTEQFDCCICKFQYDNQVWDISKKSRSEIRFLYKERDFCFVFFIGPESDHWLCLSLTDSLPHSCLVNLMPVNDANCWMMSQQLLKIMQNEQNVWLCEWSGLDISKS